MLGVEGAGDLEGTQTSLLRRVGGEGRELLEGAGDHDLPSAVLVGSGETVARRGGDDVIAVTAEDRRHAGGSRCGRSGHGIAALAYEDHGLLGRDDSGADGCRDLPDAVPCDGGDLAVGLGRVGEQAQNAHEPGTHEQRLGHSGVTDRVGVALGAVPDEIDARDGREPAKAVLETGYLQPGREETGGL